MCTYGTMENIILQVQIMEWNCAAEKVLDKNKSYDRKLLVLLMNCIRDDGGNEYEIS